MSVTSIVNGWFARKGSDDCAGDSYELVTGDFKLDLMSRRAYVRGHDLELTSAEFDLLRFLLSHPKKLVTPRTVLSTHMESPTVQRTEFIKTLMSLRRKLAAVSPNEHYLRTEPWVLYSFNAAG